MCRLRVGAANSLFSLWRAFWRPTAPASQTKSRRTAEESQTRTTSAYRRAVSGSNTHTRAYKVQVGPSAYRRAWISKVSGSNTHTRAYKVQVGPSAYRRAWISNVCVKIYTKHLLQDLYNLRVRQSAYRRARIRKDGVNIIRSLRYYYNPWIMGVKKTTLPVWKKDTGPNWHG
jgi:hypothetical protein